MFDILQSANPYPRQGYYEFKSASRLTKFFVMLPFSIGTLMMAALIIHWAVTS